MGTEKTWYGRVDWCRGCMPMSGAMLVKGSSEGFEVKVCVHLDSVLCPLLFIVVLETLSLNSTLGSPGRTSMSMTLLSLLNHSRNVSGDS